MLSFENVARNAQRQTIHEPMYDVVAVYLDSLPRHPGAFTPLSLQPIPWPLPFEPATPLTAENTARAPFTTKKALQNKSDLTRYRAFGEHNRPIIRQVLPQWFQQPQVHLPPPPPPPPPPPQYFPPNSSASWSTWLPPPQQTLQQLSQPMTVWPLQSELPPIQPSSSSRAGGTHRPSTLHSNVTQPTATMTAHGEIQQETELTTAVQGLRINGPPESLNSSRGHNNTNTNNNNNNNTANSRRRRNRKRHPKEPVHKDIQIPSQNENEESPPVAVVNLMSSENKREERPFAYPNRAEEGDEIMKTLGRGSQGHRGGRAGRGNGGGGGGHSRGGGRRHRAGKLEQPPTQQTPTLSSPLLFSNGAAAAANSTDAPAVSTRTHPTRPHPQHQQQINESFRHSLKISGNNARRGNRMDLLAAN